MSEERLTYRDCPDCFASDAADTIIDRVHPRTGKSLIYGKTLEDVRREYPDAVKINIDEWCKQKAARQDSPLTWTETTDERYDDMLNVLPPAAWHNGAFLVGEAQDHHATTGRPRFTCCKREHGKYYVADRPMTHKEFCALFGNCSFDYAQ